jgi:hypothetical protein
MNFVAVQAGDNEKCDLAVVILQILHWYHNHPNCNNFHLEEVFWGVKGTVVCSKCGVGYTQGDKIYRGIRQVTEDSDALQQSMFQRGMCYLETEKKKTRMNQVIAKGTKRVRVTGVVIYR